MVSTQDNVQKCPVFWVALQGVAVANGLTKSTVSREEACRADEAIPFTTSRTFTTSITFIIDPLGAKRPKNPPFIIVILRARWARRSHRWF